MQLETEQIEIKLKNIESYTQKGGTVILYLKDKTEKSITFSDKKEQKEFVKDIKDYWNSL